MIAFDFPYPPSVNHYWGQSGKRRFITKKGTAFREQVVAKVIAQGLQTLAGDCQVFVVINPPDKRRRDIDNPMKALLDAMEHAGVYEDDSQIVKLDIEKHAVIKGGKCRVVIIGEGI